MSEKCKACQENDAQYWSTVDVWSDEDIHVCSDCNDLLHELKRLQFNSKGRRLSTDEKRKVDNAWEQLHKQYQENARRREKAEKAYRKAYNAPLDESEQS